MCDLKAAVVVVVVHWQHWRVSGKGETGVGHVNLQRGESRDKKPVDLGLRVVYLGCYCD